MSAICNLVLNPSKINSSTLNAVNHNYRALLQQYWGWIVNLPQIYAWRLIILASNWSHWNFTASYSLPFTLMPSAATSMLTPPSTTFASDIIGWECTPISPACALPALVVPSQTLPRANPPIWCTTFQSKRHSSSCLSMPILRESILALMVLTCIWLHAVVWMALLPWNPSSMQIPKTLHRQSCAHSSATISVTPLFWTRIANSTAFTKRPSTFCKSIATSFQEISIIQWWWSTSTGT